MLFRLFGLVVFVVFFGAVHSKEYDVAENVVIIDGPEVDLTLQDLKKTFLSAPKEVREKALVNKEAILEAINSTYMTKVAAERARRKHLDKKPEVEAEIWNKNLNVLAGAELQDIVEKELKGNDEDFEALAREEYLANKDRYRIPERVRVFHILLSGKKEGNFSEDEILKELNNIRAAIEAGNITFEEAANKYSDDSRSASKGGDLGYIKRNGRAVKSFEEAAFSTAPGRISGPVKTRFGYHLIFVKDRLPESIKPFEDVKAELMKQAKEKVIKRIKEDYWLQIEGDPSIKVNNEAIEKFMESPRLY